MEKRVEESKGYFKKNKMLALDIASTLFLRRTSPRIMHAAKTPVVL